MKLILTIARAAALLLVCLIVPSKVWAQCDTWLHGPAPDPVGLNNVVTCQTLWDPDGAGPLPARLVVGGQFTTAEGQTVNCVAQWDGTSWLPLSTGVAGGLLPRVEALAVFNGDLIAGGSFTTAGGIIVNNIARWSIATSSWQAMGSGATNEVLSLGVYNGNLYAGGNFLSMGGVTCNFIARWNGSTWSAIGPATKGTDSGVQAMIVWNSQLIIGGIFTHAGGTVANRIATWNDTVWGTLGSGFNNRVDALCLYNNILYAGGTFTGIGGGGSSLSGIAFWNGSSWQQPGSGLTVSLGTPDVASMVVYAGALYLCGHFDTAGGMPSPIGIATWNNSSWNTLPGPPTGRSGVLYSLGTYNSVLIAGGNVAPTGAHPADAICTWDQIEWSVLVPAMPPRAMTQFNSNLVVAGDFTFSTPTGTATRLVNFDGTSLSPVQGANSISNSGFAPTLSALASFNGQLIVGGTFNQVQGGSAQNIAAFNPTTSHWSSLAAGLDGPVYALLPSGGQLYAAGAFANSSGNALAHVGQWNGNIWRAMSNNGGTIGVQGQAYALCEYNNQIVVGGSFSTAGGIPCGGIASWDGMRWHAFDVGTTGTVYAIAVYQGQLIIAGQFNQASSQPVHNIAAWNGATWNFLNGGLPGGIVRALAVMNGYLYGAGEFSTSANHIARWDGTDWQTLGNGTDDTIYCMLPYGTGTNLHVGGLFKEAGASGSPLWAAWNSCQRCTSAGNGDGDGNGVTDGRDITGFIDILAHGAPPTVSYCAYDMNGDGSADLGDLPQFTTALLGP